ncbi:E3 ubiquitin-protein ligase IPI1 isoform X1 [Musa acuminata AAA Group]|uniref:E3 ubiquitin-protein ligase IPI1 isoform X1 n=1 Tax=Musa acuminata AAA Group TaxID=214697 RepID=UPI0031DD82C9
MGLGGAAKDTKEREEVVHIACSICLEAVKSGGGRSTARLQCGHEFHLDCIGSAFNAKGVMQCPNCRKVEEGNWLYANGSHPTPELNMDDYIHDEDLYSLGYMENPFGGHWCPFRGLARIPSLFEFLLGSTLHRFLQERTTFFFLNQEGESSPPVAFRDPLGYHAIVMENQATLSAAHPCPFIGARLPQTSSSSSNHPFDVHTDGPGYHYRWSHFPSARDVQNPLMMAPSNLHYRGWQHHHPSYSPNAHVGGADAASGFPRLRTDGLPTADSVFHLFVLSHGSGSRAGATSSSVPSLVPPYLRNHGNIHERYRLQTSQSLEGTAMLQPGSSRGFNPLDQCGPFLVSPAIPLGQTAVDAENMGSNRLCAWERECFASHHPYSRVDRECSCWGPFPPAIGVSDSNPRMTFFPPNVPEISSSQAGYNRSVPPAHMLSLM